MKEETEADSKEGQHWP